MTQYFFGDKSRRKLKDVIARVDGGRRSSRPTPTRRIPRGRSAGSALRWGAVSTEITAATAWGTWGTGYYQEYDDAGATVGSPVEVDNWYPTPFAVDTVVCVDTSFSPPRVVSASCEVMPE